MGSSVLHTLLSTTFQTTASGKDISTFLKPDGLSLLKGAMQNHIHIVLERLLENHYDLYATSTDPDILLETGSESDLTLKTYIAPMLSRKEGGRDREAFVPKIVQFLDDLMGMSRGKKVDIGEDPQTEKITLQYYPIDMGQALVKLINKHESQDPVVRRSMFFLAQLCERLGDGKYTPAHKLH